MERKGKEEGMEEGKEEGTYRKGNDPKFIL